MGDSEAKEVDKIPIKLYPSQIYELIKLLNYVEVSISEDSMHYAAASEDISSTVLEQTFSESFSDSLDKETKEAQEEFKQIMEDHDGIQESFNRGVQ